MPNLLNPTNDPRVDAALRNAIKQGLLWNSELVDEMSSPAGMRNYGRSGAAGLLGAAGEIESILPRQPDIPVRAPFTSGYVPVGGGLLTSPGPNLFPAEKEQVLPPTQEVADILGADLSTPSGQAGLFLFPDLFDLGRGAMAMAPTIIKKGGKKGAKSGKKSKVGGLLGGTRVADEDAPTTVQSLLQSRPDPQDVAIGEITTPGAKVSEQARRVGTTGQYRGAPRGTASPQKLGALRTRLKGALERGTPGRFWYDRSSQAARDLTADLPGRTQRYAGNIAVTSADTAVPSNAGFAIKGYNQGSLGDDIITGRYPQRMGQNISQITRGDDIRLTDKVGPFFEANTLTPDQAKTIRPTNDLWMARAFGYTQKDPKTGKFVEWSSGLGEAQHRFMDEEITRLVEVANREKIGGYDDWTPERVQASIWVATKAEREGTDIATAATDFATGLPNRTVSIASESTPSTSLGHLPGVVETPEGRQLLFEAQQGLLSDAAGRDVVATHAGALTRPSVRGSGIYEDTVNPVTKTQILGGTQTGSQLVDPASNRLARGIGGVHGMLKGQDTVAVKFLRPADEAGLRNSLRVEMGNPIDGEGLTGLQRALDEQFGEGQVIADFHENGVDLLAINLDEAGSTAIKPVGERIAGEQSASGLLGPKRPAALTQKTNKMYDALGLKRKTGLLDDGFPDRLPKDWQQEAEQVVLRELNAFDSSRAMDNTAVRTGEGPAPGLLGSLGGFKPSAFMREIDAAGEQFAKNIDPLVRWAGRAFEDVDAAIARTIPNAGKRAEVLQKTRQALAEGGLDRVRELVKQGVLPAVVLGVIVQGAAPDPEVPAGV